MDSIIKQFAKDNHGFMANLCLFNFWLVKIIGNGEFIQSADCGYVATIRIRKSGMLPTCAVAVWVCSCSVGVQLQCGCAVVVWVCSCSVGVQL